MESIGFVSECMLLPDDFPAADLGAGHPGPDAEERLPMSNRDRLARPLRTTSQAVRVNQEDSRMNLTGQTASSPSVHATGSIPNRRTNVGTNPT